MTHLSKILPLTNVLLDVEAIDKQDLFAQIALLLEKHCSVARTVVLENLLAREVLGSTGLGRGVAVPHGRIKGMKTAMAAFVRLKHPVDFDSPDHQPVQMMIVVLIPDNVTQEHLEILSEIAEMFSNEAFRGLLSSEPSPGTIHEQIISWKPGRQSV